jgi:large subunit ribosomal protein L17
MRHLHQGRRLGRTTEHRQAMLKNMVTSFLEKERVKTTVAKAREARPLAALAKESAVTKHFRDLGPRFSERTGGYTRIVKLEPRAGDGAQMALLELVGTEFKKKQKKKKDKDTKKPK